MANKNPIKDPTNGKFTKKVEPVSEPVITDFINQVKIELIQGYFYADRVQKAFQLITGNDAIGNNLVMRRTVLNYDVHK